MAKSFQAPLERTSSRLNWLIVRVPLDVSEAFGKRGMLRVKGTINGFRFRTSLFPTGKGYHVLLVNKRMQAGAKTSVGAVARILLEPDTEERSVTVPAELESALAEDRALRRWFDRLNYSTRKYLVDSVTEVKSAEARVRRAGHLAERLLETMEAEHELPPLLRTAFARNPQAYAGWKRMSVLQRRGHLLGIFGYRDPKSRARRMAKMLQEAARRGQARPS
jgi:uncharacterized protein YdeI (YjbR/CyaY-like superfamily)